MNYRFFKDTSSSQFITNFTQVPELRPKVNDIVTFPPNRTKFVITRETQISSSFDYFVRQQNSGYDTVSLRASNENVMRQILRG